MKFFYPLLFVLFSFFPALVLGKELSYYLSQLEQHPKVKAIEEQQRALRYQSEGAMGLPDPTIFLGVDNVPVSDPSFDQYLPSSKVIGFSQNIPNPATRGAQRDIFLTSASGRALFAEYTISQLRGMFFTRLAGQQRVHEQVMLEQQKRDIIGQLHTYYAGQLLGGEGDYSTTFLTEVETAEVDRKLNTLAAEQRIIEADLIQLVGEVPQLEKLSYGEKQWDGSLQSLYPVQLAMEAVRVEEGRVKLADSEYRPDFGVVGTYKIREDGVDNRFEGDDWFSLQFRMTIPLWASSNQQPKLQAAKSRRQSAQFRYRELLRKWQQEVTRLESLKEAAAKNIVVLNQKERAFSGHIAALEKSYTSGEMELAPILLAELKHLTLLSQIATEQEKYSTTAQELDVHIREEGQP